MKIEDIDNALLVWGPISQEGILEIKKEDSLVFIPENRPHLIGLRHNIPLLRKADIDFLYCTDNMLGLLFYKEKLRKTLLFYKEIKEKGVIGICGSLYVALLSKLHNVPIKIISGGEFDLKYSDRDASTLDGKIFVLEENKENFVIKPQEELVEWEILR